jgi:pimeloyl-ACP methyl ester carboxylesterase
VGGAHVTEGLLAGPYRTLQFGDGSTASFYVMPFDKQGRCEAPATREELLRSARDGEPTDVYLFSHGFNNAWKEATRHYDGFVDGYMRLRRDRQLDLGRSYRPLLVGVFWPSAILVLPGEHGPAIAGVPTVEQQEEAVAQERREVQEIAAELDPSRVERFYQLAQREGPLTDTELAELAEMLAPLYRTGTEEQPREPQPPDPQELVEMWTAGDEDEEGDPLRDFGTTGGGAGGPAAAGFPSLGGLASKARDIVRQTALWMMKDRAGTVGALGVGPLLRDLLAGSSARLHLIGHSFGCKVCLSAICQEPLPAGRAVNSLLLLQPAVNYLCFAKDATGAGQPGGYRPALERVEQPILSTFSQHDQGLRLFHLALRRASDLGEARIAGAPPSRYAALGGYGPGGVDGESREIPIRQVGEAYDLGPGAPEIYGVDGTAAISSHGDISNPATWWALYSQVAAGGP